MEREFEIGKDESWSANLKKLFDEFLQAEMESIHRNRTIIDKLLSDAQQNDNARQNIANQALQNAVETANMTSKQAVRHGDLAIDRQWNVDEQGLAVKAIVQSQTFKDAIAATVAAVISETAK